MSEHFQISSEPVPSDRLDNGGVHALKISVGSRTLTRLLRGKANEPRDSLHAPLGPFAFWLADNWWRLRHEAKPIEAITADWRLAHDMSDIGGGTAWPVLRFWGEGSRVGVESKPTEAWPNGPVRYLTEHEGHIAAEEWERETDRFIRSVIETASYGHDRDELQELYGQLVDERNDSETRQWRTLEAKLGFDPDDAPDDLMEGFQSLLDRFDLEDIEEAVQSVDQTLRAADIKSFVDSVRDQAEQVNFESALDGVRPLEWSPDTPIWEPAEDLASKLRSLWGLGRGAVSDSDLAARLGLNRRFLDRRDLSQFNEPRTELPFGIRVSSPRSRSHQAIALKGFSSGARRFELARAVGDYCWTNGSSFGPLSKAGTDRQQFQRAFAQELLAPFASLKRYAASYSDDDEMVTAAARNFRVSEAVIRVTMVKKGMRDASFLSTRPSV